MDIKFDSLIAIEKLRTDMKMVFGIVDKNGSAVLLKDDKPAYVLMKFEDFVDSPYKSFSQNHVKYTLHEAMKIVLMEADNRTMSASELADIIYYRGLYRQRDGAKAGYNQIRTRSSNYPELFEALTHNRIKLRDPVE